MNPLTNMKNVTKLSEQDLHLSSSSSWHNQYRDSAWIFIGGLPFDLTEGDIICIFSQYGEVVNINLIRAKDTGKSKGFCFLCYEDQRSTVLAVDNLNGIKILNRAIRVDHVSQYKVPKEHKKIDEETKKLYQEGCAPKAQPIVPPKVQTPPPQDFRETLADTIQTEIKLPPRLPIYPIKQEHEPNATVKVKKEKKNKKKKSKKKKKKSKKRSSSESDDSSSEESDESKDGKRKLKKSMVGESSTTKISESDKNRQSSRSHSNDTKHINSRNHKERDRGRSRSPFERRSRRSPSPKRYKR